jgi:hypothetical protein
VLLKSNKRALIIRSNVLSLKNFDLKFTRLAQLRLSLRLLRNVKLVLNTLKSCVELEDACLEFNFSDEKLVFGIHIVVNEFF